MIASAETKPDRQVTFGPFVFDPEARTLHRDGIDITPGSKSLDVLGALVTAAGKVVTKDELVACVWLGLAVEDNTIQVHISALRKLLGEGDGGRRYILTVPGKGYRFLHEKTAEHEERPFPAKPSIAVLPFQNLGAGPDEEYFVDGIAEDIIMALSRMHWLFVIGRNSSFVYKRQIVEPKRVSRELGVRYLLDGSIRKSDGRVRITAQLTDATSGEHLWSDHFDGDLGDIFKLQDEIASKVASAVAPRVELAEIGRAWCKPTEDLGAYDCYLRGLSSFYRESRQDNIDALQLFTRATEMDPAFASAYGMAARCYVQRKNDGWVEDADFEIAETRRLARRAAELGPNDSLALCSAALGYGSVALEIETARELIDRSVELNTNLAIAWANSAWIRGWMGEHVAAMEHAARAIRLSPVDPRMHTMEAAMAFSCFFIGDHEAAIDWAEKAARHKRNYLPGLRVLAASYALANQQHEARAIIGELVREAPHFRLAGMDEQLPYRRPEDRAKLKQALGMAGLPH